VELQEVLTLLLKVCRVSYMNQKMLILLGVLDHLVQTVYKFIFFMKNDTKPYEIVYNLCFKLMENLCTGNEFAQRKLFEHLEIFFHSFPSREREFALARVKHFLSSFFSSLSLGKKKKKKI